MLFSIAIIILIGMFAGFLCKKCHLPSLFGMILTGLLIGPYVLNLLDESLLAISPQLRKIALIIILMRAGLSLNLNDLKKVGRSAILMCFVPAVLEMTGMILIAPRLLNIPVIDAAVMGAVIAAVSPAVIVPKMIKLMEDGYGTAKSIPQLILAGASVDDVFVIVAFTALTQISAGENVSALQFVTIPASILTGIAVGFLAGFLLALFFRFCHMRDTIKVLILLSLAFLAVTLEDTYGDIVPFSGLLAIMCAGISLRIKREPVASRLSTKFNKLWVGAEIMLFVLVGATVNPEYAVSAGPKALLLLFLILLFRMLGVILCMIGTKLNSKERLFCAIAYLPKATVQAAIGGIPFALGLSNGELILTVAVLAILITAPVGAFLIDLTYHRLLTHDTDTAIK